MKERFPEWIDRYCKLRGLTVDEVREQANILPRRWGGLIAETYPPTSEEAEEIATGVFGLFPIETYTSPRYWVASKLRAFLGRQQPSEEYQLMRLWPIVMEQFGYRTEDEVSDIESDEIFEQVLLVDKDDSNW